MKQIRITNEAELRAYINGISNKQLIKSLELRKEKLSKIFIDDIEWIKKYGMTARKKRDLQDILYYHMQKEIMECQY